MLSTAPAAAVRKTKRPEEVCVRVRKQKVAAADQTLPRLLLLTDSNEMIEIFNESKVLKATKIFDEHLRQLQRIGYAIS